MKQRYALYVVLCSYCFADGCTVIAVIVPELRRQVKRVAGAIHMLPASSAYPPHLIVLNVVSDHIWHSDFGCAIRTDQRALVFLDICWLKMSRETVTVSFAEGNSAVNAASEYVNFDRKLQTKSAVISVLTTCHTL